MAAVRATSGEDLTGELGRGSSTDTAVIAALMNLVCERGRISGWGGSHDVDSDLYLDVPAAEALRPAPLTVSQAARRVLPMLRGAFSLSSWTSAPSTRPATPTACAPLVLGRLEHGWVIASETAALDIVGATVVREVEPARDARD